MVVLNCWVTETKDTPAASKASTILAKPASERVFGKLATLLAGDGFDTFIVAGGETSGIVVQSLGVTGFHIGPQIAPGVPWVRAVDRPISLALKSGNFGKERFFFDAQQAIG